jgi:molybdopterin converting factor small subunit
MIKLTLQLHGILREYFPEAQTVLTFSKPVTLDDIRQSLASAIKKTQKGFDREKIVDVCAFATDEAILPSDHVFECDASVSVLPPVSGG